MHYHRILFVTIALLWGFPAQSETKLDIRLDNARLILEDFQRLPERAIPQALLDKTAGIIIVPNVLKLGLGVGARFGRGIIVRRSPDGRWLPPLFVNLSSASIGWQAGAQSIDLVLVVRDPSILEKIRRNKFTLGADAAVAAGPLGRSTSASTDFNFDAAIYSYSRSQGLFAGVSLEGAILNLDYKRSARFYKEPAVSLDALDLVRAEKTPASATALMQALTRATGLPGTLNGPGDSNANLTFDEDNDDSVETFGLGESPVESESQNHP